MAAGDDSRYNQAPPDHRGRGGSIGRRGDPYFGGPRFWGSITLLEPATNTSSADPNTGVGAHPFLEGAWFDERYGWVNEDSGGNPTSVRFQFNPANIRFDYEGSAFVVAEDSQNQQQSNITPGATTTSFSFDLYFDRTYEVIGGSKVGVLTDVRALERICGVTPDKPYMRPSVVNVLFARPVSFHYKGVIQRFSVDYNHFSRDLVPMRCLVNVSVKRISSTWKYAAAVTMEDALAAIEAKKPKPTVKIGDTAVTVSETGVPVNANGIPLNDAQIAYLKTDPIVSTSVGFVKKSEAIKLGLLNG